MKIFSLILVLTLSTKSYAGLFCGDFKCDLDISKESKLSRRVLRTEIVKTTMSDGIDAPSPEEASALAKGHALRNPMQTFNGIYYDRNVYDYEYRDCTATSPSPVNTFRRTGNGNYVYGVTADVTCTKITFDKKNKSEINTDLCLKVTECASNIKNSNDIKDYIALKDSICGKSPDIISDENRVDSRGRGTDKKMQYQEGGEMAPGQSSSAFSK
jgi:hypothetical protein